MIQVNDHLHAAKAQLFDNDPYANVIIAMEKSTIKLQMAYLGPDSKYFNRHQDKKKINLSEWPQIALKRVLRALYGSQLFIVDLQDLNILFPIFLALQITNYINKVTNFLSRQKNILYSIEFISFSYKYKIEWTEISNYHYQKELQAFIFPGNYLKLDLVDKDIFFQMMIEFAKAGEHTYSTINKVMELYFARNSISYKVLLHPNRSLLKSIWEENHHVTTGNNVKNLLVQLQLKNNNIALMKKKLQAFQEPRKKQSAFKQTKTSMHSMDLQSKKQHKVHSIEDQKPFALTFANRSKNLQQKLSQKQLLH